MSLSSAPPMSGDMLPSTLMAKMLSILPEDHKPCWFLHCAFLHRLPADIRCHLVDDDTEDPIQLSLHADRIFKSRIASSPAIHAVSDYPEYSIINSIRQPTRPTVSCRPPTPSSSSRRSATPHSVSRHSDSPDSLCWYHRNHAKLATKCKALCSLLGN